MKIESNSSLIINQLKPMTSQKIVAEVNTTNTQPENRISNQVKNVLLIGFIRQACKARVAL